MFARKLAVLTAVLVAAPAAYADFSSDLYFGDPSVASPTIVGGVPTNLLTTLTVDENATVNLELWMNHTTEDNGSGENKKISAIHFNLGGGELDLTGAGMNAGWTWDPFVDTCFTGSGGPYPDNDISDDGLLMRLAHADPGVNPPYRPGAGLIKLGSLSFTAPAYVGGGDNTYTLDFETGGTYPTALGSSEGASNLGGSSIIDITVMPEPATLGLLCLGGASLLLRRRRR